VFFCNSGTEASELAIKMARKFHASNGQPEKFHIITFEGAFHGRSLGALAATGNAKYLEGFGPTLEGFDQVAFGDLKAVEAAITPATAAIYIEPVIGEGGIIPAPHGFLKGLRSLCDQHGLLLMFDEIQCGVGRTGKLFAHEWAGITPDIMALAKGLGGGFPLGAVLATEQAAKGMVTGSHGSTFGGNPLATAVGIAVLDVVLAEGFLDNVQRMAINLKQKLERLKDTHPTIIEEVRGQGLMMGLKVKPLNTEFVKAALDERLLVLAAGENVVRLLPPLIVDDADIAEAVVKLEAACVALEKKN
jgi:acetylornithine/N-succinyldiaminopimelate aminotransferase